MTAWVEWTEGVGPVGVRYTPMPVTTSIPSQPAVIGNNRRLVCPLSARRWVVRLEDGACAAAIGTGNAPPAEYLRPAAHRHVVDGLAALAAAADGPVALPWQGLLVPVMDQITHPSLPPRASVIRPSDHAA